ncbi:MAG TPA: class I SAM-dependent methyltransferase, partial [Candidatus Omnitrophota bacterium]|nr:class I SAM-dependent methyltransferase [Candidatus Omnitrophota bacterium]
MVKNTDPWVDGIERSRMMAVFLKENLGDLSAKTVLDLGCGFGGISMGLAESCGRLYAVDSDQKRVDFLSARVRDKGYRSVSVVHTDAEVLPFEDSFFDLVILNGVLEWSGCGKKIDPRLSQLKVLREVFRVLKKNGTLYLAVENRFFPFNIFRDPHCRLPFVAILPFKLSDLFSRMLSGRPYETPIYSYYGLKNLL